MKDDKPQVEELGEQAQRLCVRTRPQRGPHRRRVVDAVLRPRARFCQAPPGYVNLHLNLRYRDGAAASSRLVQKLRERRELARLAIDLEVIYPAGVEASHHLCQRERLRPLPSPVAHHVVPRACADCRARGELSIS